MGVLFSKFWGATEPEDYDIVNPKTGLTGREVDLVKSTWEIVKTDVKGNGIDLFMKMFDRHPEYQKMFRAFANVPQSQLRTNGRLLGHATSVMYAITSCIDNLTDPVCLTELLVKIGESHIPRNVHGEHFANLATLIMELLEEKLGPKLMNDVTKVAWQKTLDAISSIIVPIVDPQ